MIFDLLNKNRHVYILSLTTQLSLSPCYFFIYTAVHVWKRIDGEAHGAPPSPTESRLQRLSLFCLQGLKSHVGWALRGHWGGHAGRGSEATHSYFLLPCAVSLAPFTPLERTTVVLAHLREWHEPCKKEEGSRRNANVLRNSSNWACGSVEVWHAAAGTLRWWEQVLFRNLEIARSIFMSCRLKNENSFQKLTLALLILCLWMESVRCAVKKVTLCCLDTSIPFTSHRRYKVCITAKHQREAKTLLTTSGRNNWPCSRSVAPNKKTEKRTVRRRE